MILSQFKRLVKHSAIYGLSGILSAGLAFLLTPLYTRNLSPTYYGIFSILIILASFAAMLFQMGSGTAVFRSIIQREADRRNVYSTAFFFTLVIIVLGLGISLLLAEEINNLLFGNLADGVLYIQLVVITAAMDSLSAIPFAKLRIEERSITYSLIAIGSFLLGFLLNIYLVAFLRLDILGILIANLIRGSLVALVAIIILTPDLRLTFSIPEFQELIRFGLPLVPISLAALVLSMSDRFFLNHYSSLTEVGIYSLGYKVASILLLLITAFQIAWPTILFRVSKNDEAREFYKRALTYYFLFLGFIGLLLSVFSREIIMIISTPSYYDAWKIVPIISAAHLMYGVYFVTAIGVNLKRKPERLLLAWIFGVILNLTLNYVLIPSYGMYGAAISTFLSYFIVAIIATILSLKLYDVEYEYSRLFKTAGYFIICYLISLYVTVYIGLIPSIILKFFLVLLTPILLWLLKLIDESELEKTYQFMQYIKNRIQQRYHTHFSL